MKWINGETWESKRQRKEKWHTWFAWYPVKIGTVIMLDGKIRHVKHWMCLLERRGRYWEDCEGYGWLWEYREIEKKINPEKMERPEPWPEPPPEEKK